MYMAIIKRILPFILLVAIALVYTQPFFKPGFFETDDGQWAVIRLAEMQREIKDGQIPPRWSEFLNHGFGYPLFSFTYPFPFYMGLLPRLLHFSLVDSIKIIFVASVILSAIFMYLLGREIGGQLGGFFAAVFYTVAPFRLVDLYIRGSIGESVSLALFPMLFYFSLKYILKPTYLNFSLTSFVLAILILSHNISSLIFFPFWLLFLYVVVSSYFEDVWYYSWRHFLPIIIVGLGLSAYFFIPAIFEKKYIYLAQIKLADLSENFVKYSDYLSSVWRNDKPSFQLGWAHILSFILGIIGLVLSNKLTHKKYLYYAIYFISSITVLIFFTQSFSMFLWQFPPLKWFDFPWRLLTPLAFFLALSSVFLTVHKGTKIIGVILVIATVVLSYRFVSPRQYVTYDDMYYATNDATTTSMDELTPIWTVQKPTDRYQDKVEIDAGQGQINNVIYFSNRIKFLVSSTGTSVVKVNTLYFPGWEFYIDNKKVPLDYQRPDGLIRFVVSEGMHTVEGRFVNTPIRVIANIISIISFLTICILLFSQIIKKLIFRSS